MTRASALIQPTAPGYAMVELDPEANRDQIQDVDEWAFAFTLPEDARGVLAFEPEPERTVGVRHGEDLVAVHSSFESEMTVPGGKLPTAGLTWVGVHPGHRRRGLARAMLTTHLQRTAERGEPLSALFAAEPEIYGRYGYGLAATGHQATLPRGATLRKVPGTDALTCSLERASRERHAEVVADLLARTTRPGLLVPRRRPHLDNAFVEVPTWRKDAEERRIAIVRDAAGDPRAFATFRRTLDWEGANPNGRVAVALWTALDGAAEHTLWTTLLDLDLMGKVSVPHLREDSPLLLQLENLRSADLRTWDNLWLRIVDLPTALAARHYRAEVDVVIEVRDDLLPANAGKWRLRTRQGGAEVTQVGGHVSAAVSIDVADLSAVYLGGVRLSALVQAGVVQADEPEAAAALATALAWDVLPVSAWDF